MNVLNTHKIFSKFLAIVLLSLFVSHLFLFLWEYRLEYEIHCILFERKTNSNDCQTFSHNISIYKSLTHSLNDRKPPKMSYYLRDQNLDFNYSSIRFSREISLVITFQTAFSIILHWFLMKLHCFPKQCFIILNSCPFVCEDFLLTFVVRGMGFDISFLFWPKYSKSRKKSNGRWDLLISLTKQKLILLFQL